MALGIELRFSCLHGKHITHRAIFPVPRLKLFQLRVEDAKISRCLAVIFVIAK